MGTGGSGRYDDLYKSVEVLWPMVPGRMVTAARKRVVSPGRALDIGCGDGKHILYLENRHWCVDGVDVSEAAHSCFEKRLNRAARKHHGRYYRQDAVEALTRISGPYDLVICYGLLHCLRENSAVASVLTSCRRLLRKRGLLAFAAINDSIELPAEHGTSDLFPRRHMYYVQQLRDFEILCVKAGHIIESHLPTVGRHRHGLTWILARKP